MARDRSGQPFAAISIFNSKTCKSATARPPFFPCKFVAGPSRLPAFPPATLQIRDHINAPCYRPKMPRATEKPAANPRSPIKPPERCPSCNSRRIAPKGSRAQKLETIRLYRCKSCGRTFTPGPRALRNKTYPLHEIIDALSI